MDTSPRRVAGLRREELAALAGMSVDYYVRLEQGRTPNVSDQVLESVARALRLNAKETMHLKTLARPEAARVAPNAGVRPALHRLLEAHRDVAAFIVGRYTEVLAWNRLADEVFEFGRENAPRRHLVRYVFTDPEALTFYPDWEEIAAEFVAYLHSETARHPDDPRLASLVTELGNNEGRFLELWARHDVHDRTHGPKRIRHPEVGEMRLSYEILTVPSDPDLLVTVLMPADDDYDTVDHLRVLAARASSTHAP